jgi:hypothetical protein
MKVVVWADRSKETAVMRNNVKERRRRVIVFIVDGLGPFVNTMFSSRK